MNVRLQRHPFEPGDLLAGFSTGREETGALVSFTGLMRAEQGEAEVLELDAYPGFTEVEIGKAVLAAIDRFDLQDVLVVHRYGALRPGEPIVFVATAAGHRRSAFEGADFLMDTLKSRVPLWKRSRGPGGDRWIEPSSRDEQDLARWALA